MTNSKYGLIEQAEPQFPVRELLVAPHGKGDLILSFPAFGSNTYKGNLESIGKSYSHPKTGEKITFRPATTSESISAAAYGFGSNGKVDAKRDIFDPRWLQAGYIVKTKDGVFTNTTMTDESRLKEFLNGAQKVNGIYLLDNGIAFAPYDSFERGVQDCDSFAQGGLARALEHTPEKVATNLREIASPKIYKNKKGVDVWGFDSTKEPTLRIASLGSGRGIGGGRLHVDGSDWGGSDGGYAFGVLNETSEAGSQKK